MTPLDNTVSLWFFGALALFLIGVRSRLPWTRVGGGIWLLAAAGGIAWLWRLQLSQRQEWIDSLLAPDRLPVTAFGVLAMFAIWWSMHREQTPSTSPRDESGLPRTWLPARWLSARWWILSAALLAVVALAWARPTTATSDLPWFLGGLALLSHYFDPWFAFGLLPLTACAALFLTPWLDTREPEVAAPFGGRKDEVPFFLFGWCFLGLVPLLISVYGTSQPMAGSSPADAVSLSQWLWGQFSNSDTPDHWALRELPGLLLLTAIFVVLPWKLPDWKATRGIFQRHRRRLGRLRYALLMVLVGVMVLVPMKLATRWLLGIGYWLALPEWGFGL